MNPNVKEKWVKDLRPGHYQQGKGMLRTHDDAFCCLGVLCDLYGRATEEEWEGGSCDEDDCSDWEMAGGSALLPIEVQEWAGLTTEDPIVNGHSLSDWNDGQNRSFSEIADMIRSVVMMKAPALAGAFFMLGRYRPRSACVIAVLASGSPDDILRYRYVSQAGKTQEKSSDF